MTDRLSAKERAKEIVGEVVAGIVQEIEDRTGDSVLGPTTKWINDELVPNAATQVSNAEQAAAEAERERIIEDPATTLLGKDLNYFRQLKALVEQHGGLADLLQPITDKSICSRGHPRACLEHVPEEFSEPGKAAIVVGCSACTQLEAELKPYKDVVTRGGF